MKQEDLFTIVRQVMRKIDQWQCCDKSLEEELRKCLKCKKAECDEFGDCELSDDEPKLKVIETGNDDDIVKVDVVMRRERCLLQESFHRMRQNRNKINKKSSIGVLLNDESKNVLKQGLELIRNTKNLQHVSENIKMFDATLEKWPECLPESVEIMKKIVKAIKEQEWLEQLKGDLQDALDQLDRSRYGGNSQKDSKSVLSSFHIKPTVIYCTDTSNSDVLDEETQTATPGTIEKEIQSDVEENKVINGTISEVELSSVTKEIQNSLEGDAQPHCTADEDDIAISEINDEDNSDSDLNEEFEEDEIATVYLNEDCDEKVESKDENKRQSLTDVTRKKTKETTACCLM